MPKFIVLHSYPHPQIQGEIYVNPDCIIAFSSHKEGGTLLLLNGTTGATRVREAKQEIVGMLSMCSQLMGKGCNNADNLQ